MNIFTVMLMIWYACLRWFFLDYFEYDKHIFAIYTDPYINMTSVFTSIYLFFVILYDRLKHCLNTTFHNDGYYELMCGVYFISTVYLFIYHAYCFSFVFYSLLNRCSLSLFFNFALNPIPLCYFSIKMHAIFKQIKIYARCAE